ncbi:DUF3867 domain-containing protein [Clostridium sporogenes]|uniref:DUF3867 domain-containing protein n=2 Tax=Clostridium TaxID=1485 RepID=A0A7X5PBC1_CLOSG|nr:MULTISPECIES: DUF3867 domain-containing protein [Clostridium]AJD30791.1 hypothetical protein T258_3730 [Clostridium botulinum Prevot_594]AVP59720.1 DUF3867 domain-containing protein [Clostridium botulinum]AKC61867.1 hypothetical protein DUF3867 [Clostridium sporogenes]AKJ89174.1 toxin-antitoxin system toxin component, PIN family protein [Clostridium sporogenes]AVP63546.1 DUF3867 domain-containing protein [Clostridium botulinum]
MSEIINFNDLKNKATDKDLDKFEQYMYSLYSSVVQGTLTMSDFMEKIQEYMGKNNISQEKFVNIQKKLMEKYTEAYGINFKDVEKQMKDLGVDVKGLGLNVENFSYDNVKKNISFHEKYNAKPVMKQVTEYHIKNDKNDVKVELIGENVFLKSSKKIDLKDTELNEFLCSYKKLFHDKQLSITVCESITSYNY